MSSEWPLKRLSEVADFHNHRRVPLKSLDRQKRQGKYPYYGASGVVDHIDDYIFDGVFLLVSEDGENLRTRKTPIAFKTSGKFWVNNHAHILQEKEEGVLDYLEYYFSILDLTPFITGAVQPKLNKANLETIEIPVPPKDERLKINQVLNSFTNKIELNTQINQTLEQIAQALFKSWFVDFDPVKAKIAVLETGGTAEAAELAAMSIIAAKSPEQLADMQQSQPEAYQQLTQTAALFPSAMQNSELGQIPEGWGISSIDKSFKVVMGQSPKGDTYNDRGDGTLFYQGRAEFGWRFPSPRLYTTDPKRMANKGDVLMSIRAPVGDLNIALNDCCVGRGLCSLRHDSGSTTYTYYLLKQLQIKFDTFSGEGTVFGSINQKDLKSIQFIAPVHEIINAYIGLAEPLDKEIKSKEIENKTLFSVRDALIPRMLSDEINLTYLNKSRPSG